MKTATISDVTQDEFDSAVQTLVSGIKSSDSRLDTRLGTVLRSLLVNPEARISATTSKQIDYVRQSTSLKSLKAAEEAGEDVDINDVNAIMSNFNIKSLTGTVANGIVKISVTDGRQSYKVSEGSRFTTSDNLVFTAKSTVVAKTADSTLSISSNAELFKGSAGYFFLVPVVSEQVGSVYNIAKGTSISVETSLYTFVSAEAYTDFNGGSDVSGIDEAISSIPSGLSLRGFVNKDACTGMLRDRFDSGNNPIRACSTVGYGNGAQRRDKHNVFGVGVGGRIDLYVRNFICPFSVPDTVKGKKVEVRDSEGNLVQVNYELDVTPEAFPGNYWVKSVSSTYNTNSSLEFSCVRQAYGVEDTWHDFDISKDTSEIFNTIWQGLHVTVKEVPPDIDASSSDDEGYWSEERDFQVTVYCLPQANDLQEYVDRDDVRSVSTDVVVRCPILCNVALAASVLYDPDNPMDEESVKSKIFSYINNLGFVKALTRSEIVHILKECGAVSVNLEQKDMLYGTVYDAYGKEHSLSGDSLQLDGQAEDGAMLSSSTTVFVVEPENIQITFTPDK